MSKPINYVSLAAALLDRVHELMQLWLPAGHERNGRWYVGDFDGNPGESANVNLHTGQWIDNAAPREDVGGDLISLYARIHNLSQHDAAIELMEYLGWQQADPAARPGAPRPAPVPAPAASNPKEPPAEAGPAPAAPREKVDRWVTVVPVPKHAPTPTKFTQRFKDKTRGGVWVELESVCTWEYVFEGERLGYTARFERTNSSGKLVKDVLPFTWCQDTQDPHGGQRWHSKQWPEPRPLYVPATVLSGTPADVPVVIVEGEKCADAGHRLLGHEFDFVSWPGGCKVAMKARWAILLGRTVYLWPDADAQRQRLNKAERESGVDPLSKPVLPLAMQPGYQAMVGIGQELLAEHGCTVHMVRMDKPGERPDGWDIADAVAEGWDAAKVRDFIRAAEVFRPPDDAARAKGLAEKSTPSSACAGPPGDVPAWRDLLVLSSSGAIQKVRENVVLALDGRPEKGVPGIAECAGLIGFNEFSNNVEKRRKTPWGTAAGPWEETDELLMGDWLLREHWLPSMARETLIEAVLIVATRHTFHPVRQRVEAHRGTWDGVPRLNTWLRRVCLEDDEWDDRDPLQRYLARAGAWFIMAMCCRVLTPVKDATGKVVRGPGTKFDYMLIFEGPQGWGKSTLAATLGGEHFADTGLMIGEKDSYQNIQGVHVYEWGELENLSRSEVTKVKLFCSSPKDRFRASFDKRPRDYPRQVVFVGSTNESHYLTDLTGNRRFWPVRVTRPPDLEWLRENLAQMIAEALHRLDANEPFWPSLKEQRLLFDPQQKERTVVSSLESAIRSFLYDEDQKVSFGKLNGAVLAEVGLVQLLECIGYTIDKQTDVIGKKAAQVMSMLGWKLHRKSTPGRPYVYRRPDKPADGVLDDAGASLGINRPPQGNPTEEANAPPF